MNEMYDHIEKYLSKEVRTDIRLLISDFTILWSNYEKYLFKNGYSWKKAIYKYINSKCKFSDDFKNIILTLRNDLFCYLNDRNIEFNYEIIVNKFSIRIRDDNNGIGDLSKKELLEIMKLEEFKDVLAFLFLIVGRVRNNMFHGIKQVKELEDNKNLFILCNKFLSLMLKETNMLVFI